MNRTNLSLVCGLCLAFSLSSVVNAQAQPDDDEQVESASRYLELAKEARERKDYERALEYLRQADRLEPDPLLHYNMALLLVELGRNAEALEEYEYVLENGNEVPIERRQDSRQEISRLEPLVGLIVLDLSTEGAAVRVDQRAMGTTPDLRPLRVDPGIHEVTITKDGFETSRTSVEVQEGQTKRISPTLERVRDPDAPPPPPRGFFARHKWSVRLALTAAVLGGVGGALGVWTWRDYRDLAQTCAYTVAGCPSDRVDSVERKALATNIVFGTAAALAVGAVIKFLFEDGAAKEHETPRIVVVPQRDGAAVQVRF